MSALLSAQLPDKLYAVLDHGVAAILATQDEGGWPHLVMTWAVARDRQTVRFIADHNTTTSANLDRDGRATLQIIAQENIIFSIKGRSKHIRDRVAAASFAMIMMEMAITEVKDISWPIVEVTPLTYKWLGEKAPEFERMEQDVLAELRTWSGEEDRR